MVTLSDLIKILLYIIVMASLILIVDDDADDREMLRDAIHDLDGEIECKFAGNGEDALHFLDMSKAKPDLIFLDLNMPRLNGKQFLHEVKRHFQYASIPVVIYTTSKLKEDREETKKLGATYFITKPTKLAELHNELRYVFLIMEKSYSGN